MKLPKGWPTASSPRIRFIHHNEFDKHLLSPETIKHYSTFAASTSAPPQPMPFESIPLPNGPSSASINIRAISDPNHPAHGQYGLFAVKHIPSRSYILDYTGIIMLNELASPTSDYCYRVDSIICIDAEFAGNEARFINDYRGTAPRANAEFRTFRDQKIGCIRVGIWSLTAGIKRGEEIVVSYGKGFWKSRIYYRT